MTMTEVRGRDSGVTWKEAVESARVEAGILPEVLRESALHSIALREEEFDEDSTPEGVDAAIFGLQEALPFAVEELLEGTTSPDQAVARCIRDLAAEVLELRARVATLEAARS
jgi:hypothetical protein